MPGPDDMKDVFFIALYFFYTKASHSSRFTFQFLTFNQLRESIFFSPNECPFFSTRFEVYNWYHESFPRRGPWPWSLPATLMLWVFIETEVSVPPSDQCLLMYVPWYHLSTGTVFWQHESIISFEEKSRSE